VGLKDQASSSKLALKVKAVLLKRASRPRQCYQRGLSRARQCC